jgi:hypothetical protein
MSNIYLVAIIVIVISIIVTIILLNRVHYEPFENITDPNLLHLVKYNINSLEEARQLVDGGWNETLQQLPKPDQSHLYYSVFSNASRTTLTKSPFTWKNISLLYNQRLPTNCQIDDSKIVFTSKPLSITSAQDYYTQGIDLHNNKGNGPLAMNLGLNLTSLTGSTSNPNGYTISFLMKFNMLLGSYNQRIPILNMKANTSNNNGINISATITNKNNPEFYTIDLVCAFGDGKEVNLGEFDVNTQPNFYYVFSLIRHADNVNYTVYTINTLLPERSMSTISKTIAHNSIVEFSNKSIVLSGAANIINLLAFSIHTIALDKDGIEDLVQYWKTILLKTGHVAIALCNQALAMRSCPFADSNVCNACQNITDWRNTSQIIMSPLSCRTAFNNACLSNNSLLGCECYTVAGMSNQECVTWRNMLTNSKTCTQTELDNYMKTQKIKQVVSGLPSDNDTPTTSIRNFISKEDYEILMNAQSNVNISKRSFMEWLFGL